MHLLLLYKNNECIVYFSAGGLYNFKDVYKISKNCFLNYKMFNFYAILVINYIKLSKQNCLNKLICHFKLDTKISFQNHQFMTLIAKKMNFAIIVIFDTILLLTKKYYFNYK